MSDNIVTLTLNPALDETWHLDALDEAVVHRALSIQYDAGGKGVNLSRILHRMGVKAPAAGPVGGADGHRLIELLRQEGVEQRFTELSVETRRNLTLQIRHPAREIKINQSGPMLSESDLDTVCNEVENLLRPGAILAVCGGLPPGIDIERLSQWLRQLSAEGIQLAIDGDGLSRTQLEAIRPWLLKVNLNEFQTLMQDHFVPDLQTAMTAFRDLTGAMVVVTDGDNGIWAIGPTGPCLHRASLNARPVSTVGAGDAFLAGLLMVLSGSQSGPRDLTSALKWGVAAATAMVETPGTALPVMKRIQEWRDVQHFLDDQGRVRNWPAKNQMKTAVLAYLATLFESDRMYTQQEVDAVLIEWHTFQDHFILRRGLIEGGFMSRTPRGDQYWKNADSDPTRSD